MIALDSCELPALLDLLVRQLLTEGGGVLPIVFRAVQ
jgi:hypothetical protein